MSASAFDVGFDAGAGANGEVRALAVLPDDSILVGGEFTEFQGVPRSGIARLHPDGQLDASFLVDPQLLSSVSSIAVQADGRIILVSTNAGPGGAFVVRVNGNGSTDGSFAVTLNGPVHAVALGTNGSIWLGGEFTEVNGLTRPRIVRLTDTGAVDLGFDAGTGPNGPVFALLPTEEGGVLAGGQFTSVAGTNMGCLVRFQADGGVDLTFDPRVGYNLYDGRFDPGQLVRCLAMQADGKVLMGGKFFAPADAFYRGTNGGLSRLLLSGRADPEFNGVGGPQLREVFSVAVTAGERIVVGGSFQGHGMSCGRACSGSMPVVIWTTASSPLPTRLRTVRCLPSRSKAGIACWREEPSPRWAAIPPAASRASGAVSRRSSCRR